MTQPTNANEVELNLDPRMSGSEIFEACFEDTKRQLVENMGDECADIFNRAKDKMEDELIIFCPVLVHQEGDKENFVARYAVRKKEDGEAALGRVDLGPVAGWIIDNPAAQAVFPIVVALQKEVQKPGIFDYEAEAARFALIHHAASHFKKVVVTDSQIGFLETVVEYMGGERANEFLAQARDELARLEAMASE